MNNSFYPKENIHYFNQLKQYAPEQFQAFSDFNAAVFKEGALTKKEKQIIAVAIAHVTECPYCINSHTLSAKAEGATLEELVEAAFVTAGVEAGGAVTHSTHMQNAMDAEGDDTLYKRSNLKKLGRLSKYASEGFKGYLGFSSVVMKAGKLSAKLKEIIAVAVAHATECPYCIDVHTKNAQKLEATHEELSEAILITSALLAGGAYTHIANMIESYGE
ncbi:carboxymuconolactone decarboxylase family protein [Neobacillus mesonae]|uniref:carboxymuconolactone decarboxylase family protein n=1 Tax=Neobacillus mesonae TaxID=1193713 RepID=UPI001FD3D849|nr:carboxymuconolactone decarboxylase family protein [Neobacillus mesonae]